MTDVPKQADLGQGLSKSELLFGRENHISNVPEFSVSQLAGSVKNTIETSYPLVRVRAECGRVSRPRSGHLYLDLKDDQAVLSAVVWKGRAVNLSIQPEEGLEIIAQGRLTTYPGQSRYQLIIDSVELAGKGALMALLEERKAKLAQEGLFDADRKQKLPFLPHIVGVVTSPSGAVIRDILHRLNDRFVRDVLIWPALVQGQRAAEQVAAGIAGFNALPSGGSVPRPDVIIVARGGGSLEDLWCFNEELVVRVASESAIPIVSAVGHETDTTLIDYVADLRAPTPTGAAELVVPVRRQLLGHLSQNVVRLTNAINTTLERGISRLEKNSRSFPKIDRLLFPLEQRLDRAATKLSANIKQLIQARWTGYERIANLSTTSLRLLHRQYQKDLNALESRSRMSMQQQIGRFKQRWDGLSKLLESLSHKAVLSRGFAIVFNARKELVSHAAHGALHDQLSVQFEDGNLDVTVRSTSVVTPDEKAKQKRSKPLDQNSLQEEKTQQKRQAQSKPRRSKEQDGAQGDLFTD